MVFSLNLNLLLLLLSFSPLLLREYKTSVRIMEAAEFEVPQFRSRAIFIGNRLNLNNPYPRPILNKENYLAIEDIIDDLKNHPRDPSINHEWTNHSKNFENRISAVEPGDSLYSNIKDAYKRQYYCNNYIFYW